MALADLFFLDSEKVDDDFAQVSMLLKTSSWSRLKTEKTLVELIAPYGKKNLTVAAGIWTGFDLEDLNRHIEKHQLKRGRTNKYLLEIEDWWHRRLLKKLGVERLYDRLD
ncbi:hypothetical protein N9D31_01450 [Oligoflexaceae bacterium]|nr:hypothetical protein [Oligoflexaceae bacterium]